MSCKSAANGFFINEDKEKIPFWIDLPKLIKKNFEFWSPDKTISYISEPPAEKIANFGLPREQQYFKRRDMPMRLQLLIRDISRNRKRSDKKGEDDTVGINDEIWMTLNAHPEEYANEIQYIKEEIYFCYYGYWVYINEVATWIPPNHYQFLTHWTGDYEVIDRETGLLIKSKYPEYRDVDRRKSAAALYFFLTTETFEKIDPKTWKAIPESDGTYKMKDIGVRTCFGIIRPKHRRSGDTVMWLSWLEFMAASVQQLNSWISTNDAELTENHWNEKMVPSWKDRPFFLKPMFENPTTPKSNIRYDEPSIKGKGKNFKMAALIEPMRSNIAWYQKADLKAMDGQKLSGFQLLDEFGKPSVADRLAGWRLMKPCMSMGAGSIISKYAFMLMPSTVENMEGKAGNDFKKHCGLSDPYQRNPLNGQTKSGMVFIYFSAYDGLEGFVGPYGESIMGNPNEEQKHYRRMRPEMANVGSVEYLDTYLDYLEKSQIPEEQELFKSESRKYPRCWGDMWTLVDGGLGFNTDNINIAKNRLDDLVLEERDPRVRGDFKLRIEDGELISAEEAIRLKVHEREFSQDYEVVWCPNDNGKFLMTQNINPEQTNRRKWNFRGKYWEPDLNLHISSGDPVQYMSERDATKREDKAKASSFAASWFRYYNHEIDGNQPRSKWKTNRFVLSYFSKHHNEKISCEEILWACVYMGCMMFPETNIMDIVEHFESRGCGGYLYFAYDITKGEDAKTPGFKTGSGFATKDDLFKVVSAYTDDGIQFEDHLELVEQVGGINSKEELTRFDRFVTVAGCLLAIKLSYKKLNPVKPKDPKDGPTLEELMNRWVNG